MVAVMESAQARQHANSINIVLVPESYELKGHVRYHALHKSGKDGYSCVANAQL
jgi:hypothetical protein